MALIGAAVHVSLLGIATAVTTLLAAYALRHREEPGALPFAALMASTAVWTSTYAASLLTLDRDLRLVMEAVQWFGVAGIPVWLLLFALAYTGHDEFVTRWTVAGLGVVPALATVLMWTNGWHQLMYTDAMVVTESGIAWIELIWGPAFWVYIVYTYALVAVAMALILQLIFRSDYLYADQSALLLVGIAAPFFGSVFDLFGPLSGPSIEVAAYSFTVTGVAFGYALFQRRLFDLVPATRRLGRNAAISQLEDGVLIVDTGRRVVYCNDAAGDILDCEPDCTLDCEVRSLVDESRIDFDAEDALAEIEHDDRVYEVRTSPITDRQERSIGHTLVFHDVTARKERERMLAAQRDDLERLEDLNTVLRGVNQALVSATDREEIERAVCERLAAADRFQTAAIADLPTWTGDADRWFVAGDRVHEEPGPSAVAEQFDGTTLDGSAFDGDAGSAIETVPPRTVDDTGTWAVVPVAYGHTVFGALGLYTDRETVSERERAVLGELGETVGHAINAVETRQLLSADAVVELEVESTLAADPLVAAGSEGTDVELAGLVPGSDGNTVAYVRLEGERVPSARDRLADAAAASVRTVRETDPQDVDEGDVAQALLEWRVTGETPLGALVEHGGNVTSAAVSDGRARYEVELASGADVRTLSDDLDRRFGGTRILSRRERARPMEEPAALTGESLADLTDRQRDAIEAAYRAGYFDWPRDSNAEEVAEALDISSATLHGHLRKAQRTLLDDLFDEGSSLQRSD